MCELHASAICLLLLLAFLIIKQNDRSLSGRWLFFTLLAFSACFLEDMILTIYLRGGYRNLLLTRILYALFMALYTLASSTWACYADALVCGQAYVDTYLSRHDAAHGAAKKSPSSLLRRNFPNPRFLSTLHAIVIVNYALDIAAIPLGSVFLNKGVNYFRSSGFFIIQVMLIIILLVYAAIELFMDASEVADTNYSHIERRTASFAFVLIGAIFIAIVTGNTTFIDIMVTVSLVISFMDSNSLQISTDKLTGINNRQNLDRFMDQEIENTNVQHGTTGLYILMIDVDFFKAINDEYGHQEGDRALVLVASVLKTCCSCYRGKAFLARYGGDEFIIVCESQDDDTVLDLRKKIYKDVARNNVFMQLPYSIQLSIGYAKFSFGMTKLDLFDAADEDLYRIKAVHHSIRGK